jgi:hypothetical protein
MKLLVKADQYAYRLYRPGGELPETLPEHKVDGHRCLGHYTTLAALLKGAREHLLKSKAARAADMLKMLERWQASEDDIAEALDLPEPRA